MPGHVKRVFPGGNTPKGFFSFYEYIASPTANKIFILKGGPGVGKSTFMRKLAHELVDRGLDIELHQCSADNDSLDGVYVPAIDLALIDGTAPHVVDPKHPGAVDEIIHLGDHWDEAGIRQGRTQILHISDEYRLRYTLAYKTLAAARSFHDEWEALTSRALHVSGLNARADELIAEVLSQRGGQAGHLRKLFASAITPGGPRNYLETILDPLAKRYVITGEPGTGKSSLLQRIVDAAITKGYNVEAYYCPLDPEKIEHAVIPALNTGFTTSTWPHAYSARPGDPIIDTGAHVDYATLILYKADMEQAKSSFLSAFERTIHHLSTAKKLHDEMEQYYVPHMDFDRIEERRQATLDRILRMWEESRGTAAD